MMKRMLLAVLSLSLSLSHTVVAAQDARQAMSERSADLQRTRDNMGQMMRDQAMEQQQDTYRDTQNPRRIRRAEEAAVLINKGDCAGAKALAVRGNDTRLAARIDQVCATTSVAPHELVQAQ